MQQFFSTIITIFCICTISNIERDYHLYRYLSMVTLGWDQPKPSYDFTTKNSGIYSSYPYDATSHSKEHGIPISTSHACLDMNTVMELRWSGGHLLHRPILQFLKLFPYTFSFFSLSLPTSPSPMCNRPLRRAQPLPPPHLVPHATRPPLTLS